MEVATKTAQSAGTCSHSVKKKNGRAWAARRKEKGVVVEIVLESNFDD